MAKQSVNMRMTNQLFHLDAQIAELILEFERVTKFKVNGLTFGATEGTSAVIERDRGTSSAKRVRYFLENKLAITPKEETV